MFQLALELPGKPKKGLRSKGDRFVGLTGIKVSLGASRASGNIKDKGLRAWLLHCRAGELCIRALVALFTVASLEA